MSAAISLEQVVRVLDPNTTASINDKISTLQAFASTLSGNLSLEHSAEILQIVPLGLFYNGFSIEDDRLTSILCDLINTILHPFLYEHIVSSENKPFLIQGLTHFTPEIRYLSLQQVFKCLASDADLTLMLSSDVFPLVVASVAFQDTKTANKACELLYRVATTPVGQEAFFSATCVTMLKQLLQINGTISFRVYELIIKVAVLSDDTFRECESLDLLTDFIKELESDDLLIKINALELMNEIAATPAGITFLEKANLLANISSVLDNEEESDIAVQLVKCAVLKFIGHLGEVETIDFVSLSEKYHLLERIEKCLETANIEILIVSLSTVGLIGSSPNGLKIILQRESLVSKFFEHQTSVGQVKAVFLQSLSKLFSVRKDQEIDDLTLALYKRIEARPSALLSLIKETNQPEDHIRIAAFAVMQAIASHIWGSQLMAQSDEFMTYILNRTTEYTEQGQSWKYAIIQTLASAPNAIQLFSQHNHYAQLQVYIRQGAHYRIVEPVAAVENS
ncbi:MAG: 26S proteasome non-ATPase regulatory subunit 5 [Benjaminiella poitrasii]|nr:MAG: 26S proteasome non-ATPase regulatory subunit 5 [Benjaminiella poitrasii]